MPQFGHCGNGVGPSYRIANLAFQCLHIKFYRSFPGMWSLSGQPSTGQDTEIRTWGKDTTYVSLPLYPISTSPICARLLPWIISMWCRSEDATIVMPHSSQLTLFIFRSGKVLPSPANCHLYISLSRCPQMNLGVHFMDLVLTRFVYSSTHSNIHINLIRVPCTQIGFLPAMRPS